MAEKKTCNKCRKSMGVIQFYNTNSQLFSDGKIPFCKNCLKEMMPESDLEAVKSVLRQIDKPFLIDIWKKAQESNNNTIGEYFKNINSLHQYRQLTWDDSIHYDKNKSVIEKEIHNVSSNSVPEDIDEIETEFGKITITKELKSKWGNYSNREIFEMERLYQEMSRSNDISTPQHKKDLHFYCKLSMLADKALDENDFGGYEKLSRQLDTLKKSAGFRPIDRKDGSESSGIRSFSQIYAEIERDGWIEPHPIESTQDIVDRTILYMSNYHKKLMNQEQLSSPPDNTPKVDDSNERD